jgi:hypothetical protein
MERRIFLGSVAGALVTTACGGGGGDDGATPLPPVDPDPFRQSTKVAMRRAATYMDQSVSLKGAYVWSYLASNRNKAWGEMEAFSTMCWMQPTGTPSVGNCLLDAYHATKDETFYKAAERTALVMMEAQHPSGGWNYIYDLAGEASLKRWYETIGINGWRLEEFQHYYGNATFDDATTAVSSQFMLRMYLEKRDPRFKTALDKAIAFVLDAQFKSGVVAGGWPQRFPRSSNATQAMPAPNWPPTGPGWEQLVPGNQNGDFIAQGPGGIASHPGYTGIYCGMEDRDYTNFVTFNDDVMGENIKFLLLSIFGLGDLSLKAPAVAAMDCMYNVMYEYDGNTAGASNPNATTTPQAGWGLQHLSADTVDAYGVLRKAGLPAAARSYEPRGLSPSVSITNATQLFQYFRLTGDKKYISKLGKVFDWIDTCGLRNNQRAQTAARPDGDPASILEGTHARVVELESNRPRFPHRYGSNIWNGAYFIDYDWRRTPSHYGASQNASTTAPRATLARLSALSNADIAAMVANSPLNVKGERPMPKYFTVNGEVDFQHLWANSVKGTSTRTAAQTQTLLDSLGEKNYWGEPQSVFTNPYSQNGPSTPYLGKEYMSTHVGDQFDTSPFGLNQMPKKEPYISNPPIPQEVINSSTFVSNIGNLVSFLDPVATVTDPTYKA